MEEVDEKFSKKKTQDLISKYKANLKMEYEMPLI